MGRTQTVCFAGTATARSQVTLVSRRIDAGFAIRRVTARFPPGAQHLMNLEFWLSPDSSAPSSGDPTGVNILHEFGQVDYVRGDGDVVTLRCDVEVLERGMFLKVLAANNDWFDHAVDVQIEIGLLTGAPGVSHA